MTRRRELFLEEEYRGFKILGYTIHVSEEERRYINSNPFTDLLTHWRVGYVAIPEGHKLYGRENVHFNVHGGITFTGKGERIGTNYDWLIGFDCNHYGDNPFVEDENYVMSELKGLVDQILEDGE